MMAVASKIQEIETGLQSVYSISSKEAWEMLKQDSRAQLIDVRTQPEWVFAGYPDLNSIGKELIRLSWKIYPSYTLNDSFVRQLKDVLDDSSAPLLFICRTGGRSLDAAVAMKEAGYQNCYNVYDGFEGDFNEHSQRGKVNGWKAAELPWMQG